VLFFKNYIFFLSPSLIKIVIGLFIQIPLITFFLKPEEIGIYALYSGLLLILVPLSDLGVNTNLQSNFYKIKFQENKIFFFNLLIFSFFLTIFWALILLVIFFFYNKYFYFNSENLIYIAVILVTYFFSFSSSLFKNLSILKKEAKEVAIVDISKNILGILSLFLFLTFLNNKLKSLFISLLITNFYGLIIEIIFLRKYLKLIIKFKYLKYILKLGLNFFNFNVVGMGVFFVERLIVVSFFGEYILGIYYLARNFINYLTVFIKVIVQVYSSNLLKIKNINKNLIIFKNYVRLNEIVLFIIFNFGLILIFFLKEFFSIITHDKFTEVYHLVSIGYLMLLNVVFLSFITCSIISNKEFSLFKYSANSTQIFFLFIAFIYSYFSINKSIHYILIFFILTNYAVSFIRYTFTGSRKFYSKLFLKFIFYSFFYILTLLIYENTFISFNIKLIIIFLISVILIIYFWFIKKEFFNILQITS